MFYTVISLSEITYKRPVMLSTGYTQHQLKRLSRWLVLVFVISWLNMAFQVPAHAAMMQMDEPVSQMAMDGMNCHCPPAVCDTVLASDNQSVDGVKLMSLASLEFNGVFVTTINLNLAALLSLNLMHSEMVFRETSSPPLLLNSILLI